MADEKPERPVQWGMLVGFIVSGSVLFGGMYTVVQVQLPGEGLIL